MTFSIYQASVPVYVRRLEALSAIIDKAAAFAAVRKIVHSVLLQARLFPDMLPLAVQVQIACGHAMRGAARLSGGEPTVFEGEAISLDDLKVRISKTLEVIRNIDAKKMDGMEDREITFPVGDRKETMKGSDYLLNFSMPNFYFHLTTAYDILRHNGVEIGKDDFMGAAKQ
ncbi:MAG: DUF1993 domain-containing protein [Devosia sp.]